MTERSYPVYYVPPTSAWPFIGALGLLLLAIGAAGLFHHQGWAGYSFFGGALLLAYGLYSWFSNVIQESLAGLYSEQMDRSFRWGMLWFIFSELMFFMALFGALFYVRVFVLEWLGGQGDKAVTHLLYPDFKMQWPLLNTPVPLEHPPKGVVGPFGLPLVNTILLVSSSVTVSLAHGALRQGRRTRLLGWLLTSLLLGMAFLSCQTYEYHHAYTELGLKLSSGIYGALFFMLTGFHGAHVFIGSVLLLAMLVRCFKGHFTAEHHFAFEAAVWYWHFVDVVWLCLYTFVYLW